jgi:hypothetical protein
VRLRQPVEAVIIANEASSDARLVPCTPKLGLRASRGPPLCRDVRPSRAFRSP